MSAASAAAVGLLMSAASAAAVGLPAVASIDGGPPHLCSPFVNKAVFFSYEL